MLWCSCQIMAGPKGNAKEKRVGSLMHILKNGTVCSQAKLLTFSDIHICSLFFLEIGPFERLMLSLKIYTSRECSNVVLLDLSAFPFIGPLFW